MRISSGMITAKECHLARLNLSQHAAGSAREGVAPERFAQARIGHEKTVDNFHGAPTLIRRPVAESMQRGLLAGNVVDC